MMQLLPIVPLPGRNLGAVIDGLRHWRNKLENVRQSSAELSLQNYQEWAPQAAEYLGSTFSLATVEALIETSRHATLLRLHAGDSHLLINNLISAELADRLRLFDDLIDSYKGWQERVEQLPRSADHPSILVPDTNVYLHHPKSFPNVDWAELVGSHDDVRVLAPMVVLRELDGHKRAPGNKRVDQDDPGSELVRIRAFRSAQKVRQLITAPSDTPLLSPLVRFGLLLDPVGHLPIDHADTEFIDRVAALQALTDRRVAVVTSDNGMQSAAMVAGLEVVPIDVTRGGSGVP